MKKKWGIFTVIAILALSFITVSAYNLQIGDIIGKVFYTDIVTVIDGKTIPSVNIGGRTAIIVEDLSDYGYDVTWSNETRTLDVKSKEKSDNDSVNRTLTGMITLPQGKVAPKGGLEVEIFSIFSLDYVPEGESGIPGLHTTTTKIMIYEGNNFATYSIGYSEYFSPSQIQVKAEYNQKKYFESIDINDSNKSNVNLTLDINF